VHKVFWCLGESVFL